MKAKNDTFLLLSAGKAGYKRLLLFCLLRPLYSPSPLRDLGANEFQLCNENIRRQLFCKPWKSNENTWAINTFMVNHLVKPDIIRLESLKACNVRNHL